MTSGCSSLPIGPIHDYRQDLFVSQLQWQDAQRGVVAEFNAGESYLAAKTALVDAHLTRISAQERGLAACAISVEKRLTAALSRFIESARFDPS